MFELENSFSQQDLLLVDYVGWVQFYYHGVAAKARFQRYAFQFFVQLLEFLRLYARVPDVKITQRFSFFEGKELAGFDGGTRQRKFAQVGEFCQFS